MTTRTYSVPFADLHATVMARAADPPSGSAAHDAFAALLMRYQISADDRTGLAELITSCERRVARPGLALDLVAAYTSLAALARWRAAQL